jgi:serine/threonine-protein kinase
MSESTSRIPTEVPDVTAKPTAAMASEPSSPPSVSGLERTVIAQAPIAAANEFYPTGTVASLARVLIGQTLDHYQLHELIGGGGMGAVFRASDTRLDREVAVKVIPNLGRDLEALRRFRVEAQSAARLDHPRIARVYHVGETEAWNYIVFEYVHGVNLRDLVIRQGPLPIDDTVCYAIQVAEALQHAAEREVVHRDIKPSNVLVTADGFVKVVDMGLARTTTMEPSRQDLTASGVTLGTFDYISPEQARDPRAADVRSDLYSLGCTMYYMLTGRPPYPEGTALQKLLMHGTVEAASPTDFRDDIPEGLVSIVRKLMAKRPGDRYQAPLDLIADLRYLAELEVLTRSQQMSGYLSAAASTTSNFWELSLPWLVGLLFVAGSTWYLHVQHRIAGAFSIPREIESPVLPPTADGEADSLAVAAARNEPRTTAAVATDVPLPVDTSSLPPNGLIEDMRISETLPADALDISQGLTPLPPVDLPLASPPPPRDGYAPNNSAAVAPAGTSAVKASARILWLRPYETGNSPSSPGEQQDYRLVTGTLEKAWEEAERDPKVEEIWLDENTWVLDKPFQLRRPWLVLRSAPGRRARLECRLPRSSRLDTEGPNALDSLQLFSIGSHHLMLRELEVVVYPPDSGHGQLHLVEAAAGGFLQLAQASVTLMPSSGAWQVAGLAAAESEEDQRQPGEPGGSVAEQEPIQLSLEDSIFRGDGDFLRLSLARRVECTWHNGLLAVSGRMIETGGAIESTRTPPTIRLDLRDVTLAAERGLARVKLSEEAPYPVCLSRLSSNCTYWSGPGKALFTLEGWEQPLTDLTPESLGTWLDLRGADNAYDQQLSSLAEIQAASGDRQRFDFVSNPQPFFSERAPEAIVRWVGTMPVQGGFEQQTAGDYLQRPGNFRPGFRPELLPNH